VSRFPALGLVAIEAAADVRAAMTV
jgi:hypothetical protein